MKFDDAGYSAAVRKALGEQRIFRIGEAAAALGVSEIEVSAVFRGQKPSQRFTEAAAQKLGASYASFASPPVTQDLYHAMDLVAQENVLPYPFRHRVQDDV